MKTGIEIQNPDTENERKNGTLKNTVIYLLKIENILGKSETMVKPKI
jgi:hypothetical protein